MPLSMDDIVLRLAELLDARFNKRAKTLDQDIDSKAHERVEATF